MDNPSLEKFVTKVLETKRLGFGDLRRLQRDILPDGITTMEEAEALLALDCVIKKADEAWLPFLASAMRSFVLRWTTEDGVHPDATSWLVAALSGVNSKTALVIAREVVRDTDMADSALLALTKRRSRAKGRVPAVPAPSSDEPDLPISPGLGAAPEQLQQPTCA
jgi:hypothetical protein